MYDVAIVGGGFAGLAAARETACSGLRVLLVEATQRLGGRAMTMLDPVAGVPFELGAEFIHGRPAETLALLREAGASDVDNAQESWLQGETGLQPASDDPFAAAGGLLVRGLERERDESVDALLTRVGIDGAREAALWARSLVAGFDAADPQRASARAIAAEWEGVASAEGSQSRPLGGYAPLVAQLARSLDPARVRVLTSTSLRIVQYDGDGVRLTVRGPHGETAYAAQRAIVTLPLGVLKAPADAEDAVAFDPPLPPEKQRALAKLIMGPVRKIVLRFATPFWEELEGGRYRDAAFFQSRDGAFRAYWTQVPVRAPFVIAWAGGPAADALATHDDADAGALARDEFGALLGAPDAAAQAYVGYATHDWQRDPHFRGAYSYVAVDGEGARAALAAPVAERLYFAGEATADDSEGGTVAGALQSGMRAARQVIGATRGAAAAPR